MFFGPAIALAGLAQSASSTPQPSSATPPAAAPVGPAEDGCRNQAPTTNNGRTIVVCAQKPQGYRIDPDIMEARREARNRGNRPKPPETLKQNTCATVGPMGCRGAPTIDLVNAATVLGEMAARASQGGNVGEMFVTDPQPSEYELYIEAKKRREGQEAETAARARAKAAQAQAQAAKAASSPASSPAPAAAQ